MNVKLPLHTGDDDDNDDDDDDQEGEITNFRWHWARSLYTSMIIE